MKGGLRQNVATKSASVAAIILAPLTFGAAPALAQSSDGCNLTWNTIDCGGETFSQGDGYKLGGTIGQADAGPLAGDGYTIHGGFWFPVISGPPCTVDADCYDGDYCTMDICEGAPDGTCSYTPIESRPYGDVFPVADGDGAVEIMDTLCILDAASGIGDCLTDMGGYMIGDIYPCWPPEGTGPDGAVEIMDTLAVLDAAAGNPGCSAWCP